MRNGDAATDAGGAKALAFQQDVENFALLQAADLGAFAGQFLEGLFFAGARMRAITWSGVIKSISSMSHIHFSG